MPGAVSLDVAGLAWSPVAAKSLGKPPPASSEGDMQNKSSAEVAIQIARHDGHKRKFSDFQMVQGLEKKADPHHSVRSCAHRLR